MSDQRIEDTLMNCPKCGFEQPRDQYCANCGVDMTRVQKKSASLAKHPLVIASLAIVSIIVIIASVRGSRMAKTESGMAELAATSRRESRNMPRENESANRAQLSGAVTAGLRENIEQADTSGNSVEETSFAEPVTTNGLAADTATTPPTAGLATNSAPEAEAAASNDGLPSPAASLTAASAPTATPKANRLTVAFAWAEVSHDWLQAMGALAAGSHRIPDLEARLRESGGAYRVLDVSRVEMGEKVEPVILNRGERFGFRFEAASIGDGTLTGAVQTTMRGPYGATRTPPAASVMLDKGQGSIISFGPATMAPAAAQPGAPPPPPSTTEIVVLILPRWNADRNP